MNFAVVQKISTTNLVTEAQTKAGPSIFLLRISSYILTFVEGQDCFRGQPVSPQAGHVLVALSELQSWVWIIVSQHGEYKLAAESVPQEVSQVL